MGLSGFGWAWTVCGGSWVCLGVFVGRNVVNFELFCLLNGLLNRMLSGF